jgi:LAS superfamily LD-carboxypeptidase LdcB
VKQSRRHARAVRLLVVLLVAVAPVLAPSASLAGPGQDEPGERDEPGPLAGPPGVDALTASGATADVTASLDELSAEVDTQVAAVVGARRAEAEAAQALADADAAVAETEAALDDLVAESDAVVIEAFLNPPIEDALETLSADSLAEATVRQSILDDHADANADVLSRLAAAQEDVASVKATQQEAADAAAARAGEAQAALDELVGTLSDQSLFVLAVEDRLDANLAEAEALEDLDPEAAQALREREGEIASELADIASAREQEALEDAYREALAEAAERAEAEEAARQQPSSPSGGTTLGPASGQLATVACPGGGSITVDSSLAGNLASMLDAAAAAGLNMCGNGYRDPAEQIALREAHCGSSYYAIYEAPSSSCSPPTARPGTSQHELGLAVDLTCNGGGALGSSSPCFAWLQANAASYGLYNLPSEPWHWSNDGT